MECEVTNLENFERAVEYYFDKEFMEYINKIRKKAELGKIEKVFLKVEQLKEKETTIVFECEKGIIDIFEGEKYQGYRNYIDVYNKNRPVRDNETRKTIYSFINYLLDFFEYETLAEPFENLIKELKN
jgi:hypothetical protein